MPDSQASDLPHDLQRARHRPSLAQASRPAGSEEAERLLAGTASLSKKPVARALENELRDAPHTPARSTTALLHDDWTDGVARNSSEGGSEDAIQSQPSESPTLIEYEDREVKLTQERKWLESDSVFMRIRREGMRHKGATQRHAARSASESALYDSRTLFGNYSVQMRH
ncbi:unnamed protein product [Prorocentrum cordatum]|uniref:Uncharacterized protein n=1 Tax=Prorocentrum cordatum TaxID=2364126 RepID=A0ABN9UXT8_9DINO|nr:unnamed protein product [Polarella glacialis]